LTTPSTAGNYTVAVNTFNNVKKSTIDKGSVVVSINNTYGTNNIWRVHAMNPPVTLLAGQTGALEFTFFLTTQLPYTYAASVGHIRIDIFPPITPPAPTAGTFYCTFYTNEPSTNCTMRLEPLNAPVKTVLEIYTPSEIAFLESEIPITITTQSP
jgi:hypothetical protein